MDGEDEERVARADLAEEAGDGVGDKREKREDSPGDAEGEREEGPDRPVRHAALRPVGWRRLHRAVLL